MRESYRREERKNEGGHDRGHDRGLEMEKRMGKGTASDLDEANIAHAGTVKDHGSGIAICD